MPNRVIKESICESEGLSECSMFTCDLYKRLITYADDYGRFNSDTKIMRARLFPREYEEITEEDIIQALVELAGVNKLSFYTTKRFNQGKYNTGIYGAFPNWSEHQRIRESKTKCPEPDDTDINDWYLRRFIPFDMRVEIVERDGFKCRICGKFLTSCRDAKRFVKLGQGLHHIDHIVPVLQGGRSTLENLRLTCPECNLKRKKRFTFKEILDFESTENIAASCGEVPQNSAIIQSNPNPNTNPNPESESKPAHVREDVFDHFANGHIALAEALEEFEKMRKQIKKPLTDRAKEGICKKLITLSGGSKDTMAQILDQSTLHCWQDVYALKQDNQQRQNAGGSYVHGADRLAQMIQRGDFDD